MASIRGSGSQLLFFDHGRGVNLDLTTNGQGTQPAPEPGKLNVEVFTSTPGTLAPGYQASVLIPDATLLNNNIVSNIGQQNVTEELLSGSFGVVDQTGHEAIEIIGSATGGDSMTVVGSAGDTIIGSTIAGNQQLIDANGLSCLTDPGPETIFGGAGQTTVLAGHDDSVIGGSGSMLVRGGSDDTIVGGSGPTTVAGGEHDSIVGGSGNMLVRGGFDDTIVGGSGAITVASSHNDSIVAGSGGIISVHGHGDPFDTLSGNGSATFLDPGHGASTVMGFNELTDTIQATSSVSPSGQFVGTSTSTPTGTTLMFADGATMFLAGVSDISQIHFIK